MDKIINDFSAFFNKYKPIFDRNYSQIHVEFDPKCTTLVSIYSGNTDSFKSDCIKCMNYLKHLDDYNSEDYHDYQEKGIIYLYLWLHYYELKKAIYKKNTLDNLQKLVYSYEEIGRPMVNIHNVYNNHIKKILNNELNDLFFLYVKFDNFQIKKECEDNRCKCAQECVNTYKNALDKCNKHGNVYFCNELENFREQYNIYMSSVTDCPDVDSYLLSYKNYSTSVIILISSITILVLSSLLFILYKFTPFGSRFRFLSKRPQRIYSNFANEEANLLYTSGRNRTPEAKPYNIAYNSI